VTEGNFPRCPDVEPVEALLPFQQFLFGSALVLVLKERSEIQGDRRAAEVYRVLAETRRKAEKRGLEGTVGYDFEF
jgi:hypothetical protein